MIDFCKAFDLVPHDQLLTKQAVSGVDLRIVVWVREFLTGHKQRVSAVGQVSKEDKLTSGVPQGGVLGPLLFLVYVNDIWRYIDSSIRLFLEDCIICMEITNKNEKKLQKNLKTLGEWTVENVIKINPSKSKAIRFTRARVKNQLGYSLGDEKFPESSSCKYLGIILGNRLNWVDQVNSTAQKNLEGTSLCNVCSQKRI